MAVSVAKLLSFATLGTKLKKTAWERCISLSRNQSISRRYLQHNEIRVSTGKCLPRFSVPLIPKPLVRLEQANDRAAQARLAATKLIQANKRQSAKAERKARAHRLIQQGVLFDLAGLEHRSRGELLGLLLAAAKTEDPQRWAAWKQAGEALLAEKGDAAG
mgnify:CR=1 FL=1